MDSYVALDLFLKRDEIDSILKKINKFFDSKFTEIDKNANIDVVEVILCMDSGNVIKMKNLGYSSAFSW